MGVTLGEPLATIAGRDDRRSRKIVVLAGQSNSVGKANTSALTDPITWTVDAAAAALAPRAGTTDNFGPDPSMGRALDVASPVFAICKFGLTGSGLADHWMPGVGWPTSPAPDPDLFDQFIAYMQNAQVALGGYIAGIVWVQGENDGLDVTDAPNYLANLTSFFTQVRSYFPGVPVVISRQNNTASVTYKATIRTAQESWVNANPTNSYLVDTDDLALQDAYHFTADSYDTLGDRFADRMLALLNIVNRAPVASFTSNAVGLNVSFTDTSRDPGDTLVAWAWTFGDGNTSSAQNPSHTYAAPGTYTVGLTVTDSNGATNATSAGITVTSGTWTVDATSGIGVPANSTEWAAVIAAAGLTGIVIPPEIILLCQEASGNLADASGNGYTFVAAGASLAYQQAVAGWTRSFVRTFENTAHRWQCTDARLPDAGAGGGDITFVSYSLIANTTSNVARAVSQIGTGPTAYIGGAANTRVQSGANGAATGTTDYGVVRPYAIRNGRTVSTTVGTADAAIKVTPTFSGLVTGKAITLGQVSGATACSTTHTGYAFGWRSHISDAHLKTILQTLGWTITWS